MPLERRGLPSKNAFSVVLTSSHAMLEIELLRQSARSLKVPERLRFYCFLDDGNNKGYGSMWHGSNVLLDKNKILNLHMSMTSDLKCVDNHPNIFTHSFRKRKSCTKLYIKFCLKKFPIHFLLRLPGLLIFMA